MMRFQTTCPSHIHHHYSLTIPMEIPPPLPPPSMPRPLTRTTFTQTPTGKQDKCREIHSVNIVNIVKKKSCKYVKLKNSAKKRNMRTTNFKKSIFSSVSSIFTSFLICVNFILICLLQKKLLLCTRPIAYITCFNRQGRCVIIFGAKGVLRFPNVRPSISKIGFLVRSCIDDEF